MSVRFDAQADRLLRTTGLPSFDANYSVCFWFYLVTALSENQYALMFSLGGASYAAAYDWFGLNRSGGDTRLILACTNDGGSNYNEAAGGVVTAAAWHHAAVVRSANNARALYLDGVNVANLTASYSTRTGPARMELGAYGTSGGGEDRFDGRVAPVLVYTAALTADEVRAQARMVRPRRLEGLHLWSPLINASDVRDLSGNARDWTVGGTLTTEADPPITWAGPTPRLIGLAGGEPPPPPVEGPGYLTAMRGIWGP